MTTLFSLPPASRAGTYHTQSTQSATQVHFQGRREIGGTHQVGELKVHFQPSVEMTEEYRDGFLNALRDGKLPGVVANMAKNGWSFSVEPKSIQEKKADISVNRQSKTVVVRPFYREGDTVGWHGGALAAEKALAKAINHGALSGLPTTVKRHGWATFTNRVSNDSQFQKLATYADGRMIRYRLERAVMGEDESGDPTGEKFFETLVLAHLQGVTEKEREANRKMGPHRDYWTTAMDYVGELLAPYKK